MDDVLRKALQDFERQFGTSFDPTWYPSTQEDLAKQLTKSKIDFETWRSKHQKVWHSLSTCALPIANMGKTVADSTSSSFPPAAAAVNGLVFLIRACESVSEAYDFIEQMFVKLSDALARWEIDFNHEINDSRKQQVEQIIVLILLIIVRSRKLIKRGRLGSYLTTWAFGKDEKTAELMQELDSLLVSEDRTRATLSLDRINALWQKAVHAGNSQVVERLNSPIVELTARTYAERTEEMVRDTGKWLENDHLYHRWLRRDSLLLLILGGPGAGKTSVATSIIGNLFKQHHQNGVGPDTVSIGFSYVSVGIDLVTMLKATAYQLQASNLAFREFIVDISEQGGLHTAREVWNTLFLGFWNKVNNPKQHLFLVIDGLDEMDPDDVEKLGDSMVRDMIKSNETNISLCICGRPALWTQFSFVAPDGYIVVDSEKNTADITKYVDERLAKVRVLRKSSPEERQTYRDLILRSCDGNFEWARLFVATCKHLEKSQIRKRLENSPKGLDQMIQSNLNQILSNEDIDPRAVKATLTWIIYSKRPLMFGELYRYVVRSTGDHHGLLWYYIVKYLSSIVQWRATRHHRLGQVSWSEDSIEELSDETEEWSRTLSLTRLTLRHSRIRDYLIERSSSVPATVTGADDTLTDQCLPPPEKADWDAVQICLQILRDPSTYSPSLRILAVYPTVYLAHHLQNLNPEDMDETERSNTVDSLVWLFHNETGHQAFVACATDGEDQGFTGFWTTWFTSNQYSRLIQEWFRFVDRQRYVNEPDILEWLEQSAKSVRSMFKPFMKSLYKLWLCVDWTPQQFDILHVKMVSIWAAVRLLTAFQHMDDDGSLPPDLQIFHISQMMFQSEDDVRRLARESELPETPSYHAGLAVVFTMIGKPGGAVRHAQAAFSQDQNCWIAAWSMAQSSAAALDMESALAWAAVAGDLNPDAQPSIQSNRAFWLLQIHDVQSALPLAEKAYLLKTTNTAAALTYLICLGLNKDGEKMLGVIQDTQAQMDYSAGQSVFTKVMLAESREMWAILGWCYTLCSSAEDRTTILKALKDCTMAVREKDGEVDQVAWSCSMAIFYLAYVENGDEIGMKMLEDLIPRIRESKVILTTDDKKRLLSAIICEIVAWKYRKLCSAPPATTADQLAFIADVAPLVAQIPVSDPAYRSDDELAIALHSWLLLLRVAQEQTHPDTEHWRQILRPAIRRYIEMLDDNDPLNDPIGLLYLQKLFTVLGDTKRASVLFNVILLHLSQISVKFPKSTDARPQPDSWAPPTETVSEVNQTARGVASMAVDEHKVKLGFNLDLVCYCYYCFGKVQALQSFHYCGICARYYCERCVPRGDQPTYAGRACGPPHTFEQVWPISLEDLDPAITRSGDDIHLSRTWIADVRKEWAIE